MYITFDFDEVLFKSRKLMSDIVKMKYLGKESYDRKPYCWHKAFNSLNEEEYEACIKIYTTYDVNKSVQYLHSDMVELMKSLLNRGVHVDLLTHRCKEDLDTCKRIIEKVFDKQVTVHNFQSKAKFVKENEVLLHIDDSPDVFEDFKNRDVLDRLFVRSHTYNQHCEKNLDNRYGSCSKLKEYIYNLAGNWEM